MRSSCLQLAAAGVVFGLMAGGSASALAQTAIPPSSRDFVMTAAESDMYEILAAQTAVVGAQDPAVKAFAQHMIEDHRRLDDALRKAAATAHTPAPPAALGGDQARLLASLQGVRGAEFDQAYMKQQVLAHTQALAVMQSYAADGADTTLRQTAQSAIPTIQNHLQSAQQLRAKLGGS